MKISNKTGIRTWVRFVGPICLIACVAVLVSLTLPYKSLGGAMPGHIELQEEKVPLDFMGQALAMKPIEIRGKVFFLGVNIEGDHYVGEARMMVENTDEIGNNTAVLIIPTARVQRIFELAVARELSITAIGYKTSAPSGHPYKNYPFYKIAEAYLIDTNIIAIGTAVEQ